MEPDRSQAAALPGAPPRRMSLVELGVRLLGFIFVVFAGQFGAAIAVAAIGFDHMLVLAAFSTGVAGLAANWAALHVFEHLPFLAVGLYPSTAPRNGLIGIALGALAAAAVIGTMVAAGWAEWQSSEAMGLVPAGALLILLAVASLGEELVFRGYGLQILIARFGAAGPILITSILFGLMHSFNPNTSLLALTNTALWGVVLGMALWRSQDLWLATGLHFSWNVTQLALGATLSGFKIELAGLTLRSSAPAHLSGGVYGPEASILTTAAAGAILLFLWKGPIAPGRLDLLNPDREV